MHDVAIKKNCLFKGALGLLAITNNSKRDDTKTCSSQQSKGQTIE